MKVDSIHPMLTFSDQDLHLHHHRHNYHRIEQDDLDDDVQMDLQENGGNSKAEMRKSNKPIMEKKRRARINNCLSDLKGILLEAMRKDPARHSKLEKADILELTVRHLQNVQRNQLAIAMATDPTVLLRFKNGFSECATEVSRYVGKLDGVDPGMRHRLSNHLGSCVNGLQQVGPFGSATAAPRYSNLSGIHPFVPATPTVKNIVNHDKISPRTATVAHAPNAISIPNLPQPSIGDFNNNNNTPFQPQQQLLQPSPLTPANSVTFSPQEMIRSRPNPGTPSAFTTVARRPPTPQESLALLSPPSSNDTPNISVSLCSGSDSSSCAGTAGLSPIDFSLKIKDKDRAGVRVLKVEPRIIYEDLNNSMNKGSMWRPW